MGHEGRVDVPERDVETEGVTMMGMMLSRKGWRVGRTVCDGRVYELWLDPTPGDGSSGMMSLKQAWEVQRERGGV